MPINIGVRNLDGLKGDRSLTTTHFVVAIFLGLLLNLDRNEWVVALSFGVLIDADHLFAVRRYVSHNGLAAILSPTWDDGSGLPWKSAYHYGDGAFIVGYLAVGSRLFYPFLFWGIHVAIDDLQLSALEYSTPMEIALFTSAVAGIVYIGYRRWHGLEPESTFQDYMVYVKDRIKAAIS